MSLPSGNQALASIVVGDMAFLLYYLGMGSFEGVVLLDSVEFVGVVTCN